MKERFCMLRIKTILELDKHTDDTLWLQKIVKFIRDIFKDIVL